MLNSKFTTIPYKEFSTPMKVLTWVSGVLLILSLIWIILWTFTSVLSVGNIVVPFLSISIAGVFILYVVFRALWLGYQRKK